MSARGTTFVGSVCQVLPGFCPALHFRDEIFHPRVFFFPSLSANSQTRGTSRAGAGAAKHPELCWWGRCPSSVQHMSFQRASTHFPAVSAALMRENHFVWPALRKKVSLSSRKLSHHQLVEWRLGVLPSPIPRKICRNLASDVEKLFESSYSQSASFGGGSSSPVPGVLSPSPVGAPSRALGWAPSWAPLVLMSWEGCHSWVTAGTGMGMAKPWGSLASPAQNSPWRRVRSSHGMNSSEDSPFDTSSGLRFKKLHIKIQ